MDQVVALALKEADRLLPLLAGRAGANTPQVPVLIPGLPGERPTRFFTNHHFQQFTHPLFLYESKTKT